MTIVPAERRNGVRSSSRMRKTLVSHLGLGLGQRAYFSKRNRETAAGKKYGDFSQGNSNAVEVMKARRDEQRERNAGERHR